MARTSNGVIASHILASGLAQNTCVQAVECQNNALVGHSCSLNVSRANGGHFSETKTTPSTYPQIDSSPKMNLISPWVSSADGSRYTQADAPSHTAITDGNTIGSEDSDGLLNTPRPNSRTSASSHNSVSATMASPRSQDTIPSSTASILIDPNVYGVPRFANGNQATNAGAEIHSHSGVMTGFNIPNNTSYNTF
jgi:hypothetical protein